MTKERFLFTSDIHLTSRPQDEYRWEIFPWLEKHAANRGVHTIFILGDLTDEKDNHPATLVNRLVDSLNNLVVKSGARVVILTGNHDYIDPKLPYFSFIKFLHNVDFVTSYGPYSHAKTQIYLIPHMRSSMWLKGSPFRRKLMTVRDYDFWLCHQTFTGSLGENGYALKGIGNLMLHERPRVISGDVHVPQTFGHVTYCGSPYPVHFGDSFQPRVLYWDGDTLKSLKRTTIKKAVITISSVDELEQADLAEGDQLKVVLTIPRSEFGSWEELKSGIAKACEKNSWSLFGITLQEKVVARATLRHRLRQMNVRTPNQIYNAYCQAMRVHDKIARQGLKLL